MKSNCRVPQSPVVAWTFAASLSLVAVALTPRAALGQPAIPPQAIEELRDTVGARVEAVTILGGDYGAAGGIYTFRGGTLANLSVSKFGGAGEVAKPRPLGLWNIQWAPVAQANLGHIEARNQIDQGYLRGNDMSYDITAVQLGGGARFHLDEHFSLAPTIGGIYGHTENDFTAHNANGQLVEHQGRGRLVDWTVDTWSVAPGIDARYEWALGRTRWELTSHYTFFHTESFQSSTPFVSVDGDSHTWENKLDVDAPLGWKLLGRELHTGGFFSRTELFDGIAEGLRENHVYTVNGRLVLDFTGRIKFLHWVGFGASYLFADHVNGWSAGMDMRLTF